MTLTALVGSFLIDAAVPRHRHAADRATESGHPHLPGPGAGWTTPVAAYSDFYQTQYKSSPAARWPAWRSQPTRLAEPSGLRRRGRASPGCWPGSSPDLPRARKSALEFDRWIVAAARLLAGLEVAPVRNSHLVKVSWVSSDPDLAAEVANADRRGLHPVQYRVRNTRPRTRPRSSWSTRSACSNGRSACIEDQLAGVRRSQAHRLDRRLEQHHAPGAQGRSPSGAPRPDQLAEAEADHEATVASPAGGAAGSVELRPDRPAAPGVRGATRPSTGEVPPVQGRLAGNADARVQARTGQAAPRPGDRNGSPRRCGRRPRPTTARRLGEVANLDRLLDDTGAGGPAAQAGRRGIRQPADRGPRRSARRSTP